MQFRKQKRDNLLFDEY